MAPLDPEAPAGSLTCPICARPLKKTSVHSLTAFECDSCGQFSDFSDRPRASSEERHIRQMAHPPDDPPSET